MATKQEEIFPNAPLVEAVFEVQFPGNPALECRRDELYSEFERDFPVVRVPTVPTAQGAVLPAMGIYQYASEDGHDSIMSSIRTVGYSAKKYPGFDKFSAQALKIVSTAIQKFKIKKLRRVGLRYINMIPFTREDGCIPLQRFFDLKVMLPNAAPEKFEDIAIGVTSRMDKQGKLTTRIQAGRSQNGAPSEALLLDFDFAMEGDLKPKMLKDYIATSHRHTKSFFNGLITPGYKEVMRGKVLQ